MVKAPGSSFAKVKPPSNIGWSSKRKFARAQTTDVSKRGRSWPGMKKLSWCSESLSAQKRAEARVKHRVQENIRKRISRYHEPSQQQIIPRRHTKASCYIQVKVYLPQLEMVHYGVKTSCLNSSPKTRSIESIVFHDMTDICTTIKL